MVVFQRLPIFLNILLCKTTIEIGSNLKCVLEKNYTKQIPRILYLAII